MLTLSEKVVRHREGLWYMTRILPYRTTENVIDGTVITFVDITLRKKPKKRRRMLLPMPKAL